MMLSAAGVVALLLAVGLHASGRIKEQMAWRRVTDMDAYNAVRTFMERRDGIPHPARFASPGESVIERWDARRWRVAGSLEAHDGSRGDIRMRYACVLSYAGPGHWAVEDLHLEKIE